MKTNMTIADDGYSLIELMIVMVMSTIVMAAIYGVYASTTRTSTLQNASAEALHSVRTAMEIMVQDIRMAGYDPLGTGDFGFEEARDTKIRITADRWLGDPPDPSAHPNGIIDEEGFERMTYKLDGNQLQLILYEGTGSETDPPQVIIDNVTDLEFSYLDTNADPITTPVDYTELDDITSVVILIEIEEPAGRGETVTRRLETRVLCRNLL